MILTAACGSSKRPPPRDDAAPKRDPAAECAAIFERFHAALAPLLDQAGLREPPATARARDAAGQAACGRLDDAARACLLAAPADAAAWSACEVEPPFVFFDGTRAREALLGAPVAAADSRARVAALAGTWTLPARGNDDAITWRIDGAGTLASRRTPTKGKPTDEPPRELSFARDRLLALSAGSSTQFVPAFVDGDQLYLSWTAGALAHPIASDQAFVLDLADHDRWLVWRAPTCSVLDPRRGPAPATCAWQDGTFTVDGAAWHRRGDVLVHPAMEVFTRQR